MTTSDTWPSITEAAEQLGLNKNHVHRLVKSGVLASNGKEGGHWRVDPAAIEAYKNGGPTKQAIPLSKIRIDGGTQQRVEISEETVDEYAQLYEEGADFPPVETVFDGNHHWLWDGFTRYFAAKKAGRAEIDAKSRPGTKRDAVLLSCGANATHGLRRTNADKRKAVETLLADKEWSKWSNNEIARRCGVNDKTVAKIRSELSSDFRRCARTVRRGEAEYEMQTENIGPAEPECTEEPAEIEVAPAGTEAGEFVAASEPLTEEDGFTLQDDDAPEDIREGAESLREFLSHCKADVPVKVILGWDDDQVQSAYEWGNDDSIPCPSFLMEYVDFAARRAAEEGQPAPVLDGIKRQVPDYLLEDFAAVPIFDQLNRECGKLLNTIKSHLQEPGFHHLNHQEVQRCIEQVQIELRFAKPHTECPKCKGKPRVKCEACRGTGYIVKGVMDRISDIDLKWLKPNN